MMLSKRSINAAVVRIGLCAVLLLLAGLSRSYAQADVSPVGASAERLREHVFTLASDDFEGRKTGTPGQIRAANYCSQTFRQNHLVAAFRLDSVHGSFRQTFAFISTVVTSFGQVRGNFLRHEFAPLPRTAKDSSQVSLGHNVGGLIIGTDLKKEIVIVSAHYDPLGQVGARVYHGADDNASGTATVLEVAALFDSLAQQGIRSRRSILFLLFSGEEIGLLGSLYFTYNSPLLVSQFVGDLNIDMVGQVDKAHQKTPNYCYLIRDKQGDNLQRVAESANRQSVNLALNEGGYDVKNDPEQFFYRSDHYNFAKIRQNRNSRPVLHQRTARRLPPAFRHR